MNTKINAKLTILLGLSLLLMPFANALTVNDFFQNFYNLIENQYAFYTIMFLVTFIFLFSVFFALTKYIPFFKGSGGTSSAGQIFALSLSAIATLSLFAYVQRNGGAGYASGFFTSRVGSWGWILLALLILAVVFFALRGKGKGILGGGDFDANLNKLTALLWVLSFILVMYGSISKNKTITNIGAVLFVIAVILTLLTGGFKFGGGSSAAGGTSTTPTTPPTPAQRTALAGKIQNFYVMIQQFAGRAQAMHVYMTNAPNPPYKGNPAFIGRVHNLARQAASDITRLHTQLADIQADSAFGTLTRADRALLTTNIANMNTLISQFIADYAFCNANMYP